MWAGREAIAGKLRMVSFNNSCSFEGGYVFLLVFLFVEN
jgi:hypothetical protein